MHELKQQLRMASTREYEKSQATAEPENEEVKSSDCRVKFTPGVIVKLPLDQHIKDVRSFKVTAFDENHFLKRMDWSYTRVDFKFVFFTF